MEQGFPNLGQMEAGDKHGSRVKQVLWSQWVVSRGSWEGLTLATKEGPQGSKVLMLKGNILQRENSSKSHDWT